LKGRLANAHGRLGRFVSDLRNHFQPHAKILDIWLAYEDAIHEEVEASFTDLQQWTGMGASAVNRGLRKLCHQGDVIARILPGPYPNRVRYQVSRSRIKARR
jgi:hypothetical protein